VIVDGMDDNENGISEKNFFRYKMSESDLDPLYPISETIMPCTHAVRTDKKENEHFLIHKEVQMESHSGTGLIYEMVLVKKLKLEASGHECR
jgi:hypothetical protein